LKSITLNIIILIFMYNYVCTELNMNYFQECENAAFKSVVEVGNMGIESYKINNQSDVSPDSLLSDIFSEFGMYDYKPNSNTYVWEGFIKKDWYEDSFKLEIFIGSLFESDGETLTDIVWITIDAITEDKTQLLNPTNESFKKIVSFFESKVAKRLCDNN